MLNACLALSALPEDELKRPARVRRPVVAQAMEACAAVALGAAHCAGKQGCTLVCRSAGDKNSQSAR